MKKIYKQELRMGEDAGYIGKRMLQKERPGKRNTRGDYCRGEGG